MSNNKTYKGLTEAQVIESRKRHGENILTPPVKESLWKRFLQTLTGPLGHFVPGWSDGDMLVFILEMAAILSICISLSEYNGWLGLPVSPDGARVFFEPVGIIIAIILASGVGFLAEVRAEKEFEVLNQVNDDEPVMVVRDGHAVHVPRREVVVGDVVMISTGEEIPADAQLLEAVQFSVDESSLTGEPLAHKMVGESEESTTSTYPVDRVYRGTKVMEGHAVGEVFAVGDGTENGKVYTASKIEDGKKTPLNEQFDRLGILITSISCVIGVLILVGRIVFYLHLYGVPSPADYGTAMAYLLQSIMIAVTLVVCAVPEGLPMAVTMALAYSMRRMLKTNNLVRKMHATETMGATTVICTDKTGTLTQNRMQVVEAFFDEANMDMVNLNMAVNSTAMLSLTEGGAEVLGNPTEGALLLWLHKNGIDYEQLRGSVVKVAEEPFSTETKYMSSMVRNDNLPGMVTFIKGAPEVVMAMCTSFSVNREEVEEKLLEWQSKAMRTLAFAYSRNKDGKEDVIFLGIVGIMDPVRDEVAASIRECQDAGIRVIMVTGDNYNTAVEIGRQVGIDVTDDSNIIARAKPMDKKNLVESLQSQGEVVAVTGDGTNDAPALKAADVGLSMGSGTSVAKEASDITIIDDSFASIGRAVMWGRSLYINIQRFILFQLTVNITACLVVMVGSFFSTEPPLTVTQMLWVNLIMDTFAALALASLPPSRATMQQPPRNRRTNIIDREMATDLLCTGLYFSVILIALMLLLPANNGERRAVFFTFFILLQFWNLFFAKTFKAKDGMRKFFLGQAFWSIAAIIFFGQLAIIYLAYNFFNISPLPLDLTCLVIIASLIVMLPKLVVKLVKERVRIIYLNIIK